LIHKISISQITLEDKYTDLLLIALNGRFNSYNWNAVIQRSGKTYSKTDEQQKVFNPGDIYFSIIAPWNRRLAVCEAMILKRLNTPRNKKT